MRGLNCRCRSRSGSGREEEKGEGGVEWNHHQQQDVEGRDRRRLEVDRRAIPIGVEWRGGTRGVIGWWQIERLP